MIGAMIDFKGGTMRKFLWILTALVLTLCCACGRFGDANSSMQSEESMSEPVTLSVG